MIDYEITRCVFSRDRAYRYVWEARLTGLLVNSPHRLCAFVGLNPSTADENTTDATVRRCLSFAKSWGYGRLCMLNIFGYRATSPRVLKCVPDPIGDNMPILRSVAEEADMVVAAWGNHGRYKGQSERAKLTLIRAPLHYLQLTRLGEPQHPLYLPSDLIPIPWSV